MIGVWETRRHPSFFPSFHCRHLGRRFPLISSSGGRPPSLPFLSFFPLWIASQEENPFASRAGEGGRTVSALFPPLLFPFFFFFFEVLVGATTHSVFPHPPLVVRGWGWGLVRFCTLFPLPPPPLFFLPPRRNPPTPRRVFST